MSMFAAPHDAPDGTKSNCKQMYSQLEVYISYVSVYMLYESVCSDMEDASLHVSIYEYIHNTV